MFLVVERSGWVHSVESDTMSEPTVSGRFLHESFYCTSVDQSDPSFRVRRGFSLLHMSEDRVPLLFDRFLLVSYLSKPFNPLLTLTSTHYLQRTSKFFLSSPFLYRRKLPFYVLRLTGCLVVII